MKYVRFHPHPSYIGSPVSPVFLETDTDSRPDTPTSTWLNRQERNEIQQKAMMTLSLMELLTSEDEWKDFFPHLCRRGLEKYLHGSKTHLWREVARQAVFNEQRSQRRKFIEQQNASSSSMDIDYGDSGNTNKYEISRSVSQQGQLHHQQQPNMQELENGFPYDHDGLRRACNNRANMMVSIERGLKDSEDAVVIYLEDYPNLVNLWKNTNVLLARNYEFLPN